MMQRDPFPVRMLKAIIFSRFEPVETILGVFIFLLGVWITIRELGADGSTTFFGSGAVLTFTAGFFAMVGLLHLIAVYCSYGYHGIWTRIRTNTLFVITLGFFFVTMETMLGLGVGSTRWAPWAALTLVSAATYLALVLKR